jgi:hypothetical protein
MLSWSKPAGYFFLFIGVRVEAVVSQESGSPSRCQAVAETFVRMHAWMIKPTLLGTSFKPFSLSRDRTIYFPSLKSLTYAAAAFTLYCAVHKQPGRRSTSKSAAASEAQRSRDVADGPVLVPACRGGTGTGQNDRAEKLRWESWVWGQATFHSHPIPSHLILVDGASGPPQWYSDTKKFWVLRFITGTTLCMP